MKTEKSLKNIGDLQNADLLTSENTSELQKVAARFSVSLTPLVSRVLQENGDDELLRQYVPSVEELVISEDELNDPIGDDAHTPIKGITHRYPDRVLLKPLHSCAVYCRFCFRREKVGRGSEALNKTELDAAINYIESHAEIWEVILSGGDPLMLSPQKLKAIIARLSTIEHVAVIRLHTRVPLVAPEKINSDLLAALQTEKSIFMVLHCNSHLEVNEEVKKGMRRLNQAGIPLLSQSVLLKGVNDCSIKLEKLFRSLAANRVKPYYLHHADLAEGTSHFRTSIEKGQGVIKDLRGKLSGICQVQYVLDLPGGFGKVPIGPVYHQQHEDEYIIEDWQGRSHKYKENN